MTALPSERHLRPEGLKEYLAAAVPKLVPVDSSPKCPLVIDPSSQRVAIRVPRSAGELPDLSTYRHFLAGTVARDGSRWESSARRVATSCSMRAMPRSNS